MISNKWMVYSLGCLGLFVVSCELQNSFKEVKNEQNQLVEKYQTDKNGKKNGLYIKFLPSGDTSETAVYQTDKLHGDRKVYGDSKKVEVVEKYKDGKFDGVYQTFYPSGKLKLEGLYVQDIMTGTWKSYYEDGTLKEVATMKDNEENGPFTEYYPNGKKKAEGNYQNGTKEHGLLLLYNEEGTLVKKMNCENGVCHTTWEAGK